MGKAETGAIIVKPQALVRAGRRLHLPRRAKEFLELLDEGTYFKRGFHRQAGTPAHWCHFDLPAWAQELDMAKSNVHRIRDYLLALSIIQLRADDDGQQWIGWNLDTTTWQAPPKHGGARPGAGRPVRIQDDNDQPAHNEPKIIQDDNDFFQDDNETFQDDNARKLRGQHQSGVARPQETLKKLQETILAATGAAAPSPPMPVTPETPPPAPKAPKPRPPREHDPYWDALVDLCGAPSGNDRASLYGKFINKIIKPSGATPEEIAIRAGNWYRRFTVGRTLAGFMKHWDELASARVEAELAERALAVAAQEAQRQAARATVAKPAAPQTEYRP